MESNITKLSSPSTQDSAQRLAQAIEQLPEILKRDLNENLCVCNQVTKIAVIEAIINGADSREKIIAATYASDGTGCCKLQLKHLLDHLATR